MNIDIGLPPIATLLIALLVLAIISDFLLELFSVRVSQSTGPLQNWIFERFGQGIFVDFLAALFFQFFSFRKKAFFLQISSLINVGSFSKKQCLLILVGSHMGVGLSLLLLLPAYLTLGMSLSLLGFLMSLLWKNQIRDFGVGLAALGLFLTLIAFFDPFLAETSLKIHSFHVPESVAILIVILTTMFFRTPVAFLLSLALFQLFIGINLLWLPTLFFLHGMVSLLSFYWQLFQGRKRMHLTILTNFIVQVVQLVFITGLCFFLRDSVVGFLGVNRFLDAFQVIVFSFFVYHFVGLMMLAPIFFLLSVIPFYSRTDEKKSGNQKIINIDERGHCFSIHLTLFLLRQEFKKYTTSVHTIFKISRESDYEREAINQKFMRYQGMLVRVGDELKELCFSIGRQRSYRWQVKEVMGYYKTVNQLELLVDDLSLVTSILRDKGLDEEWEKECRFWLGLQLKLFESFFHYNLGVGKDDPKKVKANIEKSYDILDRFFVNKKDVGTNRLTSQTFYRITESIGNLAL